MEKIYLKTKDKKLTQDNTIISSHGESRSRYLDAPLDHHQMGKSCNHHSLVLFHYLLRLTPFFFFKKKKKNQTKTPPPWTTKNDSLNLLSLKEIILCSWKLPTVLLVMVSVNSCTVCCFQLSILFLWLACLPAAASSTRGRHVAFRAAYHCNRNLISPLRLF